MIALSAGHGAVEGGWGAGGLMQTQSRELIQLMLTRGPYVITYSMSFVPRALFVITHQATHLQHAGSPIGVDQILVDANKNSNTHKI